MEDGISYNEEAKQEIRKYKHRVQDIKEGLGLALNTLDVAADNTIHEAEKLNWQLHEHDAVVDYSIEGGVFALFLENSFIEKLKNRKEASKILKDFNLSFMPEYNNVSYVPPTKGHLTYAVIRSNFEIDTKTDNTKAMHDIVECMKEFGYRPAEIPELFALKILIPTSRLDPLLVPREYRIKPPHSVIPGMKSVLEFSDKVVGSEASFVFVRSEKST
jgi:hypothetical protein